MLSYLLLLSFVTSVLSGNRTSEGCYQIRNSHQNVKMPQHLSDHKQCVEICEQRYFRYAFVTSDNQCTCSNYLGEQINVSSCNSTSCTNCQDLVDAYSTGVLVPGPPRNVLLSNITNTSVYITWNPPESFINIMNYEILAKVLQSYASFVLNSPEWKYPNDTLRAKLILHPATRYNITLRAVSSYGEGAAVNQEIQTRVGEPQNIPGPPEIIKRDKGKMEVAFNEVINDNGPISAYLIVVINADLKPLFQEQLLKSHQEAVREGLPYYIAAEIKPEDVDKHFVIGDDGYYGMYHNAPLDENTNYDVLLGIVSKLGTDVKRSFSNPGVVFKSWFDFDEGHEDGTPVLIVILSVAIAILSVILVGTVIGFLILRSRVIHRRHRLSDNQELTLQGPMIEVENNGYIPEEEVIQTKADHYKHLKEKLRAIPFNQIKIEPTNALGIGRYGRVNSGSVIENQATISAAVYSINDKKLSTDERKNMLKDLDLLIRTEKHDNVIKLMGTCETPQMLIVAIEYVTKNLKDTLLGSRDSLVDRFSNMTEKQALDLAIGVSKGMAHLESNKIVHKQLCARNIMVANGFIPKISGYGLAQYYTRNNLPDYTRWTALEVFKGQQHNPKSDVWSFACVLWEICVLGGTPYGNFSNNEVPDKVTKGLRLPQMQYFSDDLYQIMLHCWQIDMDERPTFGELTEALENLADITVIPYLSFNLYPNFQYEQFYPDMEVAVRPVF